MATRVRQGLVPIIAGLMIIAGLTAGVSASTGLELPGWGSGQELAGPLGLNPIAGNGTSPVSIAIPDATVDAEVERNQIVDGVMLDPSGPWVVSWYQETGELGEFSNTVMSGHVDYWDVGPAVFYTVAQLSEGAPIQVTGENGATYTYAVEWIRDYEVAGLTPEAINEIVGPTDYRALTLQFTRRFYRGIQWDLAYTLGKSEDNAPITNNLSVQGDAGRAEQHAGHTHGDESAPRSDAVDEQPRPRERRLADVGVVPFVELVGVALGHAGDRHGSGYGGELPAAG